MSGCPFSSWMRNGLIARLGRLLILAITAASSPEISIPSRVPVLFCTTHAACAAGRQHEADVGALPHGLRVPSGAAHAPHLNSEAAWKWQCPQHGRPHVLNTATVINAVSQLLDAGAHGAQRSAGHLHRALGGGGAAGRAARVGLWVQGHPHMVANHMLACHVLGTLLMLPSVCSGVGIVKCTSTDYWQWS